MPKSPHDHNKPQKPTLHKRCKYCQIDFTCDDNANGRKRKFCNEAHKKLYFNTGKMAFPKLVERLTKALLPQMRQIARAEVTLFEIEETHRQLEFQRVLCEQLEQFVKLADSLKMVPPLADSPLN